MKTVQTTMSEDTSRSEDARLQAAIAGNAAAYDSLLSPLLDPAFRLATVVLRDRTEAEDAVQEAALKAWSRLHQFRGPVESLRAWFLGIVMNECRMARRRPFWSVLRLASVEPGQASAEDVAIRATDLARAIARLDLDDRAALFAHFYLDLPLEESAKLLGLSLGAAKSRIYRAARRLRPGVEMQEVMNR